MKTWIALLRGINVGGHHKVPMKRLVELMQINGFADVRTYIQSGNVIFKSRARPGPAIADLIEEEFGFRPAVLILGAAELLQALNDNPYQVDVGKTVHVFFCDKTPKSVDIEFLESLRAATEQYTLTGKVFYLHAPDGIARSALVAKLGKAFPGVTMTARNLNTVNKLVEMSD
jgi:uncharacterized protein (DUF1697 family)